VLAGFRKLADTGCVEFLSETHHHSLACLFSRREFSQQVLRRSHCNPLQSAGPAAGRAGGRPVS
jgi:alpha-amylase/alpha-mannosidase (GH57 family)